MVFEKEDNADDDRKFYLVNERDFLKRILCFFFSFTLNWQRDRERAPDFISMGAKQIYTKNC